MKYIKKKTKTTMLPVYWPHMNNLYLSIVFKSYYLYYNKNNNKKNWYFKHDKSN